MDREEKCVVMAISKEKLVQAGLVSCNVISYVKILLIIMYIHGIKIASKLDFKVSWNVSKTRTLSLLSLII